MKKIRTGLLLALIFTLVFSFASCGKKVAKKEISQDGIGNEIVAVTDEDGKLERDDSGYALVAVTDENGKRKEDENGEAITEAVEITKAMLVGNTIETANLSLTIPDGWKNNNSFNNLNVERDDDSGDGISIVTYKDKTGEEVLEGCDKLFSSYESVYSCKVETKKFSVNGEEEDFRYIHLEDGGDGKDLLLGYIVKEDDTAVYRIQVILKDGAFEKLSEVEDILNTVKFIG